MFYAVTLIKSNNITLKSIGYGLFIAPILILSDKIT